MILKKMYHPAPDGLGGNDDCGQMSAWYIFTTLGFYPVCPGSEQYALGSPAMEHATLHLENGKTFIIDTKGQSDTNVYVQKVELNGHTLTQPFITHKDIMDGGQLTFYMGAKPAKKNYQ